MPTSADLPHTPSHAGRPRTGAPGRQLLKEAQRPFIIAGGGVNHSGATHQVVELADLLSIPMITSFQNKVAVPNDHQLYVGSLGRSHTRSSSEAAESCAKADVVLAVGSRLSGSTTGYDYTTIPLDARMIQIGRV